MPSSNIELLVINGNQHEQYGKLQNQHTFQQNNNQKTFPHQHNDESQDGDRNCLKQRKHSHDSPIINFNTRRNSHQNEIQLNGHSPAHKTFHPQTKEVEMDHHKLKESGQKNHDQGSHSHHHRNGSPVNTHALESTETDIDHQLKENLPNHEHHHHHHRRRRSDVQLHLKPHALDGGWGYVIAGAAFLVAFLLDGFESSYGILLPHVRSTFDGNAAVASMTGGLLTGVILATGPFSAFLVRRYGCRRVSFVGAIIAGSSIAMATRMEYIELFVIFYGLFAGFGMGLVYLPSNTMVNAYFHRKRGVVMGIVTSGSGVGLLVIASLTDYLISMYGWRGCYLIISGVLFNLMVCACLMRPLEDNFRAFHPRKQLRRGSAVSCSTIHDAAPDIKDLQRRRSVDYIKYEECIGNGKPASAAFGEMNGGILSNGGGSYSKSQTRLADGVVTQNGSIAGAYTENGHVKKLNHPRILSLQQKSCSIHCLDGSNYSAPVDKERPLESGDANSYQVLTGINQEAKTSPNIEKQSYKNETSNETCEDIQLQNTNSKEDNSLSIPNGHPNVHSDTLYTSNNTDVTNTPLLIQSNTDEHNCQGIQHLTVDAKEKLLQENKCTQSLKSSKLLKPNHQENTKHHRQHHHHHNLNPVQQRQHKSCGSRINILASNRSVTSIPENQQLHDNHYHHNRNHYQQQQPLHHTDKMLRPGLYKSDLINILPEFLVSMTSLSVTSAYSGSVSSIGSRVRSRANTNLDRSAVTLTCEEARECRENLVNDVIDYDVEIYDKSTLDEDEEVTSWSLFKIIPFDLFCIGAFLVQIVGMVPVMFIPSYVNSTTGLSKGVGSTLVSILGISNTCGRLIAGILSYLGLGTLRIYNTGTFLAGLVCFLLPVCTTFPTLAAFAVTHGFFIGFFPPLQSVILVELLGVDKLPASFGIMCVCKSVASVSGPFIAGALSEWSNSYSVPYYFAAVVMLIANVIHCIMAYCPKPRYSTEDTFT